MNKKILITALFAVLLILVMMRSGDRKSRDNGSASGGAKVANSQQPEEQKIQQPKAGSPNAEAPSPARKVGVGTSKGQSATDVGLQTLPYLTDNQGKKVLRFHIKKSPVCHKADFEAMQNGLGAGADILVTLESFDGKAQPIVRRVSLGDIESGQIIDFPVAPKPSGVVGVFVCGDQSGKGSCRDKYPADFNRLIATNAGRGQGGDAIYYFQFTYLRSDDHLLYAGLPRGMMPVRRFLAKEGADDKQDQNLIRASALMAALKSFPPELETSEAGTVVTIPIAAYSNQVCN